MKKKELTSEKLTDGGSQDVHLYCKIDNFLPKLFFLNNVNSFSLIPWNWEELLKTKAWKLLLSKWKETIKKKLVI